MFYQHKPLSTSLHDKSLHLLTCCCRRASIHLSDLVEVMPLEVNCRIKKKKTTLKIVSSFHQSRPVTERKYQAPLFNSNRLFRQIFNLSFITNLHLHTDSTVQSVLLLDSTEVYEVVAVCANIQSNCPKTLRRRLQVNSLGKLLLLHTKQITRYRLNWFVTQREHRIWSRSSVSVIKIRPDQSGSNLPLHILLWSAASYRIKICTWSTCMKVHHRNVIHDARSVFYGTCSPPPPPSANCWCGADTWYMIRKLLNIAAVFTSARRLHVLVVLACREWIVYLTHYNREGAQPFNEGNNNETDLVQMPLIKSPQHEPELLNP